MIRACGNERCSTDKDKSRHVLLEEINSLKKIRRFSRRSCPYDPQDISQHTKYYRYALARRPRPLSKRIIATHKWIKLRRLTKTERQCQIRAGSRWLYFSLSITHTAKSTVLKKM